MTVTLEAIETASNNVGSLAFDLNEDWKNLNLKNTSSELANSLKQFRQLLIQTENILRAPRNSLPQTMENLRVMSENFRELSEMAKRYPSQLLFGQPPMEVAK
jgi:hypothetical protein